MSSFGYESSGSGFKKTVAKLERLRSARIFAALEAGGKAGVAALAQATPTETGESAGAWSYRVKHTATTHEVVWTNSHMDDDGATPVVILLQYGHGTGTGGYVAGRDFINPAMKPIFEKIKADVWKAVSS